MWDEFRHNYKVGERLKMVTIQCNELKGCVVACSLVVSDLH